MKKSEAQLITHTLSKTSKMPGPSYSISAFSCQTGSKLAKIPGSVCHGCYARKNAYAWKTTQAALSKREATLSHPLWVEAMVVQIGSNSWFRWHDSGDIQSINHLDRICQVAKATPDTKHWLPTKEIGMVRDYVKTHQVPANLIIRLSAPMVDSKALRGLDSPQVKTCRTISEAGIVDGTSTKVCPAPKQGGKCGDCRNCWDLNVEDVAYLKH